jgi:5-methylcytosine-specific restriction protein A
MRTWLFLTLSDSERLYRGNLGYADDPRRAYRYDSFVPNHRQVAIGDRAIIRGKKDILGSAIIESIEAIEGEKVRQRCPVCQGTNLKQRSTAVPRFKCACGAEFDESKAGAVPCRLYSANFGESFVELSELVTVSDLWETAPRLNKQFAILELDADKAESLVISCAARLSHPDELPATTRTFAEGSRTVVTVNRYERDPRARKACLLHHGYKCSACGFDFERMYGELGKGFIEIHHLSPLGSSGHCEVDPIRDLRPLCPNCHAMVHRRSPILEIAELTALMAAKNRQ